MKLLNHSMMFSCPLNSHQSCRFSPPLTSPFASSAASHTPNPNTLQLPFISRKTLFLNSLSQTRSFSSVSVAVPRITESTLLQAVESSQRHFIEHLSPHLTPSILPSVQASFDLTTRCLAFCILYRLSYPEPSVHRLLHPLILTGAANPESILNELARARERLNVNSTSVFDALITAYCELEKPDEALECFYLMKEKGFLPNIETCSQMLMMFLKLNGTEAGEFIRHLETLGAEHAFYNYSTVVLHNGEKYEAACVMFQDMSDDGLVRYAYSLTKYCLLFLCLRFRKE